MSHLDFVKKIASTSVYNRGMKYYRKGAITNYRVRKTDQGIYHITGTIRGTYYYDLAVDLRIADSGKIYYKSKCTCPYDWGGECKHIVALLIKFFEEDYATLKEEHIINRDYRKLLDISRNKPAAEIHYFIKGLKEDKLVNFKVFLEADSTSGNQSRKLLEETIKESLYSGEDKLYKLTARDRQITDFLNSFSYSRGREGNSYLLPKTEENFIFLKGVAEEGRLFFSDNRKEVRIGKEISPTLVLRGDEDNVYISAELEHSIFQSRDKSFSWTVINDTIHQIANKSILDLPDSIRVPEKKKGEFLFAIIPALQKKYSMSIEGPLNSYRLVKIEPTINLFLDSIDGQLFCKAEIEIEDELYKGSEILSINIDADTYRRSEDDNMLWYSRNYEPVRALIEFLEEYEFHVRPDSFFIKDEGDIQEFITNGLLYLKEEWNVERSEAFDKIEIKSVELEPVIELVDNGGEEGDIDKINWFEFKVYYTLGGQTFSREELQKMIKYNKSGEAYIQINDSYFFLQEGQKEENLREIIGLSEQEDNNYRSRYYNILYYRNLIEESGISFKGNRVYNKMDEDISRENLLTEEEIPRKVEKVLRNYQKEGFYWLRFLNRYQFGGILADDMGLGKTLQALTLLKSLVLERPALIVCPRTLIYNWSEEIDKFFPDTNYLVYYGTPEEREVMLEDVGEKEIIVTSYSIISRDYEKFHDISSGFSYCILDEAQHIKNYKTKRARSVKTINADCRLALTGTPIENSVEELWSIFDFLMPGYLGTHTLFRKSYLNPIINDNDIKKLGELKKRVAPFILRRKKDQVLTELPEKMENLQHVEMTKLQQDTYQLILEEVRGKIYETVNERGFNQSRIHILAALTKLRQICNHPSLVLDKTDPNTSSGKLDTLLEMVEDAIEGGHKLVVFSQFVKMLKLIRNRFDLGDINYEYLDGSTHNRMERVNRFNSDDDIKVFLISLKAGGVGLNLTAADIVIHVDPWWNPMVERQATDRVHRIGQQKRVVVYKMVTRGTVEEKMLKLQKRKEEVFNSVIEDNNLNSEVITWEDIQELLQFD